jgi:hypothetical protein
MDIGFYVSFGTLSNVIMMLDHFQMRFMLLS